MQSSTLQTEKMKKSTLDVVKCHLPMNLEEGDAEELYWQLE